MRFFFCLTVALALTACVGTRQSEYEFDEGAYVASARGMPSLAERGDPVAQMDLGYLYEHGLGVPKDQAKAQESYEKASAQGLPRAEVCLALLLWDDKQVPPDMPRVIDLLKRADAAGDQYASHYLSSIYRKGDGVPKDETEADRYGARAGSAMDDVFIKYMRNMRDNISANQHYPATAASGHYGGTVKVAFTIQAPFAKDAKIAKSSGHADLDDAAIASVYQTYYPSLPPGIEQPTYFTVDIVY